MLSISHNGEFRWGSPFYPRAIIDRVISMTCKIGRKGENAGSETRTTASN